MKYIITTVVILIVIILIGFSLGWFEGSFEDGTPSQNNQATTTERDELQENNDQQASSTESQTNESPEVIGTSLEERDIEAYHFGDGDREIVLMAGIHGGYEWNTTLLAYEIIDWLEDDSTRVPDNLTVSVIPVLNPDGLHKITDTTSGDFTASDIPALEETIPGRFNARGVDLNRNFNCNWQSEASWRDTEVDPGEEAFSEPESRAFRDYVEMNDPEGVVVYYSAAGGVYSSRCNGNALSETEALMNIYANGSGYPAEGLFNTYEISGDAVNWLARKNIPAISVLLTNHEDVEWQKNKAGIQALLESYSDEE